MKKVLVFLCTVSLFFGVVTFAGATPLVFNHVDGWWDGVQAEGGVTLDGSKTFSYCLERTQHISIGGIYDAGLKAIDKFYMKAVQLIATFAPGLFGAYDGYTVKETGAALQLAIWVAVDEYVGDITGGIWVLAYKMLNNYDKNADIAGIVYADLGVNQDLLVFNPVPEPATMLLFGCGLIGLAVVGRKKFQQGNTK